MFPKATNSWTPLSKMATKRYYSASVPVKGKLLVLGGCDGDNSLATSEYVCSSMEMHPSQYDQQTPPSPPYWVLITGHHHLHIMYFLQSLPPLKFWQKQCLAVLPSTVQCMTTEKLSLQWEDEDQATAQVLDYSQPNPAWTTSNYYSFIYCFIWLFCTIAGMAPHFA